MQEHEIIFERYLSHKAQKYTQARKLILDTIFNLHEHFDIEQLYDTIHQISREVSRATVYRTIPLLMDAGLIQRSVRCETRDKFEHILGHPRHAHWVCKVCGAVLETDLPEMYALIESQADAQNFFVEDISVVIQGRCHACRKEENEPSQ